MGQDGVIEVVKRNGSKEGLDLDKIHKIVEFACNGITGVSVSDIEMKAHLSFYDGITTKDINKALIKSAADLISEQSPNYQYVAGKLLNYEMRKDAWGGKEPPRLYDHIVKMVDLGYYTPDLLVFYTEQEWDKLDEFIDHDRDFNMTYIGVNEYLTKYSMRDRSLDQVFPLETPQITYILVASILMHEEKSLKAVKSYYNDISLWNISLPTPIMAGIRSTEKQGSSCVLISCDDTLNSIISTAGAIMKYIASKAGIGMDISRLRAEGSTVKKDKSVKHTGITPFLKHFETAVKSCSQGGVRGGSATCYYQLWHLEVEDLLVLKNNKGTQENRVRKIDYGVQINNYLYNRFIQDKDITLFSPKDVPGLYDAFFSDQKKFAQLYEQYEKDSSIRKKKVNARELFTKLIIERKETGRIYIFNVDNVNEHGAFKVPITQSNLCAEILLPTKPLQSLDDPNGEIALCSLSAINLGNIKSLDDLEGICRNAVRGLDNLLTYQDYMVPAAYTSTMKYRPLGIGIINLAYYFAKNGVKYNDPAAHQLIHDTMEAIQFYCIKASIELAKERGPIPGLADTKYGDGLFPIDHYNKNVDEIVKSKYNLDWEWMRKDLIAYGIRNATLTAMMPAESSARTSNSTNGVESIRSLITTKTNKSHISKQVVPEFNRLKNKYDPVWEMKTNEGVIKTMAVITKFIDQSISTNLNYNPAHYENGDIPLSVLLKDLLLCNKYGLRTLYYLNTNDQRDEEVPEDKPLEELEQEEPCDSCTI